MEPCKLVLVMRFPLGTLETGTYSPKSDQLRSSCCCAFQRVVQVYSTFCYCSLVATMNTFAMWLTSTLTAEQILSLSVSERVELRLKFDDFVSQETDDDHFLSERSSPANNWGCKGALDMHRQYGARIKRTKDVIADLIPGFIFGKAKVGTLRVAFQSVGNKQLPRLVKTVENIRDRERILAFPSEGFSHPNVVSYQVVVGHFHNYLVMEYCPSTILAYPELHADVGGFQTITTVITQVLFALDYLHSCGFGHFDVKAESVGVTQDGRIVLMNLCQVATLGSFSYDTTAALVPLDIPGQVKDFPGRYQVSVVHDLFMLAIMVLQMCGGVQKFFLMTDVVRDLADCKFGHAEAVVALVGRLNGYTHI